MEKIRLRYGSLFALLCILITVISATSIIANATVDRISQDSNLGAQMVSSSIIGKSPVNTTGDKYGNVELIDRKILFGNPEREHVVESPDGKWLCYLAPVNGVMNIWVGPLDNLSLVKPITNEKGRGIHYFDWMWDSKTLLYSKDSNGDENWTIYSIDRVSGKSKILTPIDKVSAYLAATSQQIPGDIIVGLNDRNPEYHDLYRINLSNGEKRMIMKNDNFSSVILDNNFSIRFATNSTEDGGKIVFKRASDGHWSEYMNIGMEDAYNTGILGFDRSNNIMYMSDSQGRDTSVLKSINTLTNETKVIAGSNLADIDSVIFHPTEFTPQAVSYNYDRKKWIIFNKSIENDLNYLNKIGPGELNLYLRTLDDKKWFFLLARDNGSYRHYEYDRETKKVRYLFSLPRSFDNLTLSNMHSAIVKSRDGLNLVCYYTLPVWADMDSNGLPNKPLPLVLYVHGGPWSRDTWGFRPTHQWLANRGYAVLSVNFRGSTGFGKNFINAGNLQWGAKMQDDLLDAVNWSIKKGIADPSKIAIMGGSYGGYASLAGMTFHPKIFACGIDLCGPSNLTSHLLSIPPYWKPELASEFKRVGDYRTQEGRMLLKERSPLNYVDRIEKPLLIAQGFNDPRVKKAESDQIVSAMKEKNLSVTYLVYPDEGHGFVRSENKLSYYAVAEAFLSKLLGGRNEPIGDDFKGSSITVPVGGVEIPGLTEALKSK
jgi:dipeptidyl aminopeptidase/acylaminoacyl peptidase